ncbi:MAG: DUF4845 domain-containing protein [Gammaproteobacteria bacterium]|nr:DUF4845 domain-containing protein [Gammaproteobacteria bacterium]
MKKQSIEKQKGMTLVSWVVVITFIGFLFMLAVRIIPIFAEDHTIGSVWKGLESDPSLVGEPPKKIQQSIMRKLKMNNVTALQASDISIKKNNDHYLVVTEYEPRGKIIGKLDFIASFKHEAKIRARN